MDRLFTSLVLLAGLLAGMRALSGWHGGRNVPQWLRAAGGIGSWATVGAAAFLLYEVGSAIWNIFATPSTGAVMYAGSVLFFLGILLKVLNDHPEILRWERTGPFLRDALRFTDFTRRRDNVFEDAEWQQIQRTHRETTGRNVNLVRQSLEPRTERKTDLLSSAVVIRPEAVRPKHLADEIARLEAGERVDITDALRINVYRHRTHPRYDQIIMLSVDPAERVLSFQIVFPAVQGAHLRDADARFRILQELYEVLQALQAEPWIAPYGKFIATFSAECFRVETDSFDMPTQIPFLSVRIAWDELRSRADRIFIVTELPKISVVTWTGENHG